ncbi:MAG: SUMF1/EgtB/PvdO family nonheme iron enzyme [Ardenticatenia bacterium]|nr:SUMF1/EgtB/PvdO family nonheme iron enzyme [Ardenticatenia bacterium]
MILPAWRLPAPGQAPWDRPRVLRGGSWNNNPDNARASYRNNNHPNNRNRNIGFRVVLAAHAPLPLLWSGAFWPDDLPERLAGRGVPGMPGDHGRAGRGEGEEQRRCVWTERRLLAVGHTQKQRRALDSLPARRARFSGRRSGASSRPGAAPPRRPWCSHACTDRR